MEGQRNADAEEYEQRRRVRMGQLNEVLRAMQSVNRVPVAVTRVAEQASAPSGSSVATEEVGGKRGRSVEMTATGDEGLESMETQGAHE